MIAFIGDFPVEGRPWVFKIPQDKPLSRPENKFLSNPIEMQTILSQEVNCHAIWDTTGRTNLTTKKLKRLAVVPYAVVEWLSKRGLAPNELSVWLK